MASNPDWGGLLGGRARCFELCWRDVAAVAVEAVLVEPVHPAEGGEVEFVATLALSTGAAGSTGNVLTVGTTYYARVVQGANTGSTILTFTAI